ncbi:hypothetical protein P167DRAFT_41237 [Morchella conica CCBAS932]|uniref:Uncharacterized protein n=1 Tax=Morchella conica CCBAS932 TaxID=1392247 RepID=A0A3N4KVY9_9PEZI|nr:hypothetical protein P167DRAFT_41237 [Morchella conica CCBAS932]
MNCLTSLNVTLTHNPPTRSLYQARSLLPSPPSLSFTSARRLHSILTPFEHFFVGRTFCPASRQGLIEPSFGVLYMRQCLHSYQPTPVGRSAALQPIPRSKTSFTLHTYIHPYRHNPLYGVITSDQRIFSSFLTVVYSTSRQFIVAIGRRGFSV